MFSLALAVLVSGCGSGGGGGSSSQPSVTVTGNSQVRLGATDQFTATVTNSSSTQVTWEVNGAAGGNSTVGRITSAGVYTPPATIPASNTVTITAVSVASPGASGSAQVSILNPIPSITAAAATPVSGASYTLEVSGSGFVQGSEIEVGGAGVTTAFVTPTDVQATVNIASTSSAVSVDVANPNPGGAQSNKVNATIYVATVPAAARLLDQATFGPTLADVAHVQAIGQDAWIAEQFNVPETKLTPIPATLPAICSGKTAVVCEESEWWQTMLTAPDQLRQRVAFALSEIFVVSTDMINANAAVDYQNTLAADAFANFSTIMRDVTLSTGMGEYLNMLDSAAAPAGQIANENYARELMQLFTIGLFQLNQDGTLQLDANGNPIPNYTQDQVQAFAKAYTGWTFATPSGGTPASFPEKTPNFFSPMVAVESAHDTTSKTLLNGTVLPSGQTAEQDLAGALDNIFEDSNVGPFVCRQLIQHLVTSTPSPAYVSRVAAVFADNGSGVRGDMKAVLRAILEDPEARAGDTDPTYDSGHLREPMLWITEFLRAMGFMNTDANGSYYSLSNYSNPLGERPYRSASVFNFFPPGYVIPQTTLNAPEFGIENTATAIQRLSLANTMVNNKVSGFSLDLSATSALGQVAASNPGAMVDALGTMFMHGQMPAEMRSAIVSAIGGLPTAQQVRVATYLVITSPQYKIMH